MYKSGAVLEQAPYRVLGDDATSSCIASTYEAETDACSLWRQAHPTPAEELD